MSITTNIAGTKCRIETTYDPASMNYYSVCRLAHKVVIGFSPVRGINASYSHEEARTEALELCLNLINEEESNDATDSNNNT